MPPALINIAAFVFVLGVLVFVHELGHFLMAKRLGVRVLTFSLGFKPHLVRHRWGETEYCIGLVPLGGYVKMAGEHPDDPRAGRGDEFLSRTKWERFQVLVMGPLMNIALSLVVMTLVFMQGAEVPAYEQQPPVIGQVLAGSPAERGGLRPGDRIVSVGGQRVETWEKLYLAVLPRAGREVEIVYERGGQLLRTLVVPDPQTRFEMGDIGVLPEMHPQVRAVQPGQPAHRAGLEPGDLILKLDGAPVDRERLVKTINQSVGRPLRLTVRRTGRELEVVVTPARRGDVGLIGVELSPYELRTIDPTFLQAVGMSVKKNLEWSSLIFRTLWGLLTRETSPRQLMGPVAIAQLSGGAAQVSWVALMTLLAMVSLNLGILNLLPIPVLDGGHIAILALEGLWRRDFSMRVKERLLLAGFLVLMLLMVTVIYNDLMRIEWIERLVPWR